MGQPIRSIEDREKLQAALDGLVKWADQWGMAFKVDKCKVMHIGHANPLHEYSMNGKKLAQTDKEKDLGVIVASNLNSGGQCAKAAGTGQAVLGQLARAFHFRDRYVFLQLYKTYVRPHVEFWVQSWSPWTAANKEVLEEVQKRAIRMVSGLRAVEYEDRLLELGMTTLQEMRHQADMTMVFKVLNGMEDVNMADWFTMASEAQRLTRTAADPKNVRVKHGRLEIRKNFFTVRVTNEWNKVPGQIKGLRPVDAFKDAYAKHRQNAQRG